MTEVANELGALEGTLGEVLEAMGLSHDDDVSDWMRFHGWHLYDQCSERDVEEALDMLWDPGRRFI